METVTSVAKNVLTLENLVLLTDSVRIMGRAVVNLYCSPNLVAKACFATSCVLGTTEALCSGFALISSCLAILLGGAVGAFGARASNRLGKYTLHMGNVTSDNRTNATEITKLIS